MVFAKLPIDDALPALCAAMAARGCGVLQAPPGAGKTTRVPLALMDQVAGKILMLEPRRLATRAAAQRLAEGLGETVGGRVGFAMRGERVKGTKIEVVTEGILTRMIQTDPELAGIGCVIFDEFHERSLAADLGLALVWEVRQALREDLQVLVMSATLDAGAIATMLDDAPVITSQGRAYPVDTIWAERPHKPADRRDRIEPRVAALVQKALSETQGSLLVFLPGEGEIRRVATLLDGHLPADTSLHPLFGALPFAAQQAAIRPAKTGRKIVLATSIAETSLTIEDVRVVIDAGLARRAHYDPARGMSRLVTEKVTRAEATQRAGRAGRVAEGRCYKLWTKGEDGALAAFPPAEIEAADLAPFALELAAWGAAPADLALLNQPPRGTWRDATHLLQMLGALDDTGRITAHGKALAPLPVHPRLGHMLLHAGPSAAPLAALMSERDPVDSRRVDLALRLAAARDPKAFRAAQNIPLRDAALSRIREETKRLKRLTPAPHSPLHDPSEQAALAFPDRIAQRRPGDAARYLLSGALDSEAGTGAEMEAGDPLASAPYLVVTEATGAGREARIRTALPITLGQIETLFGDQITQAPLCRWSRRHSRVEARVQRRLGALVLDDQQWKDAPDAALAQAMCEGIRQLGLRLPAKAARLQARIETARGTGDALPDCGDEALLDSLEDWLAPHLAKVRSAADWRNFDPEQALKSRLDWAEMAEVDRLCPPHYRAPTGRNVAIDYTPEGPEIAIRLQEVFGVTQHPTVGQTRAPLKISLLSPAQRPIQVTKDLPGFWRGSYADVRKDMRAQYPRHPWPEDPTTEAPTTRAKPRK